jgi:hypothetical protein
MSFINIRIARGERRCIWSQAAACSDAPAYEPALFSRKLEELGLNAHVLIGTG